MPCLVAIYTQNTAKLYQFMSSLALVAIGTSVVINVFLWVEGSLAKLDTMPAR